MKQSRRQFLQTSAAGVTALGIYRTSLAAPAGESSDATLAPIDFRHSPPWWQTAICLPDDADKVLVGKDGQLLFDWGMQVTDDHRFKVTMGEDPASFAIALQPGVEGGTQWLKQANQSPRLPIMQTSRQVGDLYITEQTFIATPEPNPKIAPTRLARADFPGFMVYGWTRSTRPNSPAFNDAAVGSADGEAPIHLKLAVEPGTAATVVYGLCEGSFTTPGKRVLVLSADGSDARTVDPVADFGAHQPGLYKLTARDTDRDGVIHLYVGAANTAKLSAEPSVNPSADPGADSSTNSVQSILNTLWVFTGPVPTDQDILTGRADRLAYASFPAVLQPARRAVVLMKLENRGASSVTCQPALNITLSAQSAQAITYDDSTKAIHVGHSTRLSGSAALTLQQTNAPHEYSAQLPEVTLAPGAAHEVVFAVDRHSPDSAPGMTVPEAQQTLAAARAWWQSYDLPYRAITVPDPSIQDMLDSCVRNIWQVRELKVGGPAFQVGSTCYRGLWLADGAFILETAAMLGRGLEARSGIEYMLSQQKPDGSFESLTRYWKENGFVFWTVTRHAFLTQDREWLRRHWPALTRIIAAIRKLREIASTDPSALNYRLVPGGFIDGGINPGETTGFKKGIATAKLTDPEYSNTHWLLTGLKAFIAAAHWLGDAELAGDTQKEYDDFYSTFRAACVRDKRTDHQGNVYVPIMMGNAGDFSPQKAQWTFCHAVYPGQLFPQDDSLVRDQLAMLQESKVEGMVCDTGYLPDGLWTYFASFYAHAQLWQGNGREAAQSLYAFAQHACPTRVWHEEQRLNGQPMHPDDKGMDGDMPHNWASAEFIRLAIHMIQLDRGDELHLLEGFPREWARPNMSTRLEGVLTPFGPLHLQINITADGRGARINLKQLTARPPSKIVLHLAGLSGKDRVLELPLDQDVNTVVPL